MAVTRSLARELLCPDPEATSALGRSLATAARAGDLVCLWGDLGAGKTHLAKAFGAGLGVTDTIASPSYILMAEYEGRLPLYHVDLYRLEDAADALAGGLLDDRWTAGVVVMEWPDRMGDALPPERLDVMIDGSADEPRTIRLIARGDAYERYLEAGRMSGDPVILALDTATTRIVVALGATDGTMLAEASWPAGYRHGETLLPAIERLLGEHGVGPVADRRDRRRHRAGRVHGAARRDRDRQGPRPRPRPADRRDRDGGGAPRGRPPHGDGRGRRRRAPAARRPVGAPAGPRRRAGGAAADRDRPDARSGRPGSSPWTSPTGRRRTPSSAGEAARAGLAAALLAIGAERLGRGDVDDLATLVPEYVTLPRGVRAVVGEVEWSRDRP